MKGVVSMAVSSIKKSSAFVLTYKIGVDQKGSDIFASQKFSRINKSATDEAINNLSKSMETLLAYPLHEVRKTDDFSIVESF